MTLASYQMQYNGLVLGDGTAYDILECVGLEGLDNVRSNDVAKARDHGEWAGTDWMTGREITLTLEVTGSSDAAFRSSIEALMAATVPQPSELPFQFLLPGMAQTSRQTGMRPRKRPIPLNIDYTHRIAQFAMVLHATDPRVYDSTVQVLSTGLPVTNGGLVWPASWPIAWGASSGSGTVSCVNSGNFSTRPVITVTGPVDNPTVQNLTTSQFVTFAISLTNTDLLVIDMLNKTVTLNGTASRRSSMSTASQWWELGPGTTIVAYRANTVQVGSAMSIAFQSAWT